MDFRRTAPPLVLLCLGAGMLLYGAVFHAVTVLEEEETVVTIPVPAPFAPPAPFDGHGAPEDALSATDSGPLCETDPFRSGAFSDELPGGGEVVNPFEQVAAPPASYEENPFDPVEEPFDEFPPEETPWFPDPSNMLSEKVTKIELIARSAPEWALIREVTFGGVARLDNGELKRTYSGQPPALCPT